jgi:hypothetical protein
VELHRYWIEFEHKPSEQLVIDSFSFFKFGVTAYSREDAFVLLKDRWFKEREMPPLIRVTEDVDISTLPIERFEVPIARGIWHPRGGQRLQ